MNKNVGALVRVPGIITRSNEKIELCFLFHFDINVRNTTVEMCLDPDKTIRFGIEDDKEPQVAIEVELYNTMLCFPPRLDFRHSNNV